MGKRLLRNNILQPLTDKESINMRFESVRELINDADLLEDLRTKMRGFQDLDLIYKHRYCKYQCGYLNRTKR